MKEEVEDESSEDSEEEERKTNDFKEKFLNEILVKNKIEFDKKAIIYTDILLDESFSVKTEDVNNRSSSADV